MGLDIRWPMGLLLLLLGAILAERADGTGDRRPSTGLLIVSPTWPLGFWDPWDRYSALRRHQPIATIGHCMLVYDLDKMGAGQPFKWPPIPAEEPANPDQELRD